MKFITAIIIFFAVVARAADQPEATLGNASTVSDNDKVRIVQGGVSKNAAASLVRQITSSKINDMTVVGRSWLTTASPSAVRFPMVNADNTISYLNAGAFLTAIGAGSASVTIQEIDGSPSIPFNVLEVTNATLADQGGGVARLTIGTGGGGGGTYNEPSGYASTDKLVTISQPSGVVANVRLDAGSGTSVFTLPTGSSSDISLSFQPKGSASIVEFTNSDFSAGFGVTGSTYPGGGPISPGRGITFYLDSVYYTATVAGLSLLDDANAAAQRVTLGLVIGTNVQAWDADLDDLADGSLSGSKVGSGINAANITTGTLPLARGGMNADVSGYSNGLYGQIGSVTADIDTIPEFSTAMGITGTPSSSTVLRGDGVWTTAPGAISVKEEDSAPTVASVTEIRVTNGSLTDNGSGSVSLNLSGGGGGGDTTSDISSNTNQQIALFNGTTGKHIINYTGTGIINATAGVIGTVTNSAGLAAGLSDETGTGAAVFSSGPTFTGPQLGAASASSVTSPIFQTSAADPADSGIFRLANAEAVAWESSPAGTDMLLSVDSGEILTYNGVISGVSLQEGGNAVPNATDTLAFFSSTSSAQLAGVISDEVGIGRVVYDTSTTLTTPTVAGTLTLNNGIAYADASMGALVIDTGEMNNTKSVAVDSTFTFSATPAAGALFGLQLTNSDSAVHTMTIPSSKSDTRGGAAITTFVVSPTSTLYIKWRHEGSGVYTIFGDPFSINDLTADAAPDTALDYVMTYDASAGLHKKVLLTNLPAASGDAILVDTAAVVNADFQDGGDINFTATGASPAVITGTVQVNSVALGTDTTGNYQAETSAGLGIAVSGAAAEGFTKTVSLDTTAVLSGDHTLGANEVKFGQSGIIFEGATANALEGYISAADITSSDKTWSLPDRSGTFSLSGDTFTGNVTGTLDPSGATTLTITGNAVTGAKIAMGSDAQGDILYYDGTDYARLAASTAGFVLQTGGAGANPSWVNSATSTQTLQNKDLTTASNTLPAEIVVAASDELTALTAGTGKVTFRMPFAMTDVTVRASLTTAQASGSLITIDINEAGTSIMSTKITIDNNEKTSTTAVTAPVISDSALADDAEITVDIDTVGTSGASGLKVTLIGKR